MFATDSIMSQGKRDIFLDFCLIESESCYYCVINVVSVLGDRNGTACVIIDESHFGTD